MFVVRGLLLKLFIFALITGCQTASNKDPYPKTLISEQRVEIDNFDFYRGKGHRAYKQKHYNEALKYFLKAEEIEADNIELLGLIGVTLRHMSMHKEAIKYFEKVIKLNPDEYRAYYDIASIYKDKENHTQAVPFYLEVLKLKYNDKGAIVNLADISFKTNQYNDTLKYITMFTDVVNKEGDQLLTDKERILIRKTRERFVHYKTIIYNKSNKNNIINEQKSSEHDKDELYF